MDILIKNSKLREKQYNVHIGINKGKICSIIPSNSDFNADIEKNTSNIIDAGGHLVTPGFIEPHLHIDKCFTGRKSSSGYYPDKTGDTDTGESVYNTACHVIKAALQNGVTAIRAHVDINPSIGLKNLEAVIEAKKHFNGIFHLQVCPFPSHGLFRDKALQRLMKKAVRKGADAIGGNPASEMTWEDSKNHIDFCFKLAKYYGKPLDIHIDETCDPSSKELEYLASKKIKDNYTGSVTASHVCALSSYNQDHAHKIISLVKESGISIILMPATDLMVHGCCNRNLKTIRSAGINVAYAQNHICSNSYRGWGKPDPLYTGTLMAHSAQLCTDDEIEFLYDMATFNSARILGHPEHRIAEGAPANMIIVDSPDISEAFRHMPARLFVISRGKLAASAGCGYQLFLDEL